MRARSFKAMNRAVKVRAKNIGRAAFIARVDGRFSRTLDEEIETANVCEIFRVPDVTMDESDVGQSQTTEGQLATAAPQIIERQNLDIWKIMAEHQRKARPDEASPARYQNPHAAATSRPGTVAMIPDAARKRSAARALGAGSTTA
jgi:hypothetical protein